MRNAHGIVDWKLFVQECQGNALTQKKSLKDRVRGFESAVAQLGPS